MIGRRIDRRLVMKRPLITIGLLLVASFDSLALSVSKGELAQDPLTCTFADYKGASGLTAKIANDALAVVWEGENGSELRMRLGLDRGTPTIQELAIRRK